MFCHYFKKKKIYFSVLTTKHLLIQKLFICYYYIIYYQSTISTVMDLNRSVSCKTAHFYDIIGHSYVSLSCKSIFRKAI